MQQPHSPATAEYKMRACSFTAITESKAVTEVREGVLV